MNNDEIKNEKTATQIDEPVINDKSDAVKEKTSYLKKEEFDISTFIPTEEEKIKDKKMSIIIVVGSVLMLLLIFFLLNLIFKDKLPQDEPMPDLNEKLIINKIYEQTDDRLNKGIVLDDLIKESYDDYQSRLFDFTFVFKSAIKDKDFKITLSCEKLGNNTCNKLVGGAYIGDIKIKSYDKQSFDEKSIFVNNIYNFFESYENRYLLLQNSESGLKLGKVELYDETTKIFEYNGTSRSYLKNYGDENTTDLDIRIENKEFKYYVCVHPELPKCDYKNDSSNPCQYAQEYILPLPQGTGSGLSYKLGNKIIGQCFE